MKKNEQGENKKNERRRIKKKIKIVTEREKGKQRGKEENKSCVIKSENLQRRSKEKLAV
jgi:hypothetical protein